MAPSTQSLDILGIPGSTNSSLAMDYAELVRQGLSIESFKRVVNYYQLSDAQMSNVVGNSVRTIVRLQKEDKPLNSTWSDRLYRLARVAAQAQDVFESADIHNHSS